jgi:putative transposase
LLKHFLESALEGEMSHHLVQTRLPEQNRRNGKTSKKVKSSAGLLDLQTPRDRTGSYQPQLVPKRQVVLTPQLEQKILSLYGMGSSYADISQHLSEMYGYSLSDSELTAITARAAPRQSNPGNAGVAKSTFGELVCIGLVGWYLLQSSS